MKMQVKRGVGRFYRYGSLGVLRVTGSHRLRFLQAMTTADFGGGGGGPVGALRFVMMADAKGKHHAQAWAEIWEDAVWFWGVPESVAALAERLRKHRVADDVAFEVLSGWDGVVFYGEGAAEIALEGAGGEGAWRGWSVGDEAFFGGTRVGAWDELGLDGVVVRGSTAGIDGVVARAEAAGWQALEAEAWHGLRVAAGWPLDGIDLPLGELALAAPRLAATVAWEKGCFLGQEVFVMARDRGRLPKRLVPVRVVDEAVAGEEALVDVTTGRGVGWLGRVHRGQEADGGARRGLALVRARVAEGGGVVRAASGGEVEIVDWER